MSTASPAQTTIFGHDTASDDVRAASCTKALLRRHRPDTTWSRDLHGVAELDVGQHRSSRSTLRHVIERWPEPVAPSNTRAARSVTSKPQWSGARRDGTVQHVAEASALAVDDPSDQRLGVENDLLAEVSGAGRTAKQSTGDGLSVGLGPMTARCLSRVGERAERPFPSGGVRHTLDL